LVANGGFIADGMFSANVILEGVATIEKLGALADLGGRLWLLAAPGLEALVVLRVFMALPVILAAKSL
jgi:hypothetical protein